MVPVTYMSVPTLVEQMRAPELRARLVDDAVAVLEAEVGAQGGLSGFAIKTAFGALKSAKPGMLRHAVDRLLDEFLAALEPTYRLAIDAGELPGARVVAEKGKVAQALLKVTDDRAGRLSSELLKKTYGKLRPSAEKHVEAAAPRMATLLDRHAARP